MNEIKYTVMKVKLLKYLVSLLLFIAISCNSGKTKVPKPNNLIAQETFTKILLDVTLLDAYITSTNLNIAEGETIAMGYNKHLFDKYNVSENQFNNSYKYYVAANKITEIQQIVLDSLTQKSELLKDVEPVKNLSYNQLSTLLQADNFDTFFKNDTLLTHNQKIDTLTNYYRNNINKLAFIDFDSVSFEVNMKRYRLNKVLFNSVLKQVVESKRFMDKNSITGKPKLRTK